MSGLVVGPWRSVPRPTDAEGAAGAWYMAETASAQDPAAVRVLWDGDQVAAVGGVMAFTKTEGYAFFYATRQLSLRTWRLIWNTVFSIVWWAHGRGLRVVSSVVRADFVEGHRLIRRMGFEPHGWAPGFGGQEAPLLRYLHCWPPFEEPALVRHQRHELWRAELGAWCPKYLAEIDSRTALPDVAAQRPDASRALPAGGPNG